MMIKTTLDMKFLIQKPICFSVNKQSSNKILLVKLISDQEIALRLNAVVIVEQIVPSTVIKFTTLCLRFVLPLDMLVF